jgi:methylated-DNA-[protein]-cysteine S-methyltransferase
VKPSTLTGSRKHAVVNSPVGPLTLVAVDGVLAGLYMTEQRHLPPGEAFGEPAEDPGGAPFAAAAGQLREYFAGARTAFDLEFATYGTAFQRRVWAALQDIPYGQTVSYGQLADRIGQPSASRAVGLANGKNPIGIIVPCHRVVGADARVTPSGADGIAFFVIGSRRGTLAELVLTGLPPRSRTPGPGTCRTPRPAAAPR